MKLVGLLVLLSAISSIGLARTECVGTINGVPAAIVHTGKMVDGDIDNDFQPYCVANEKIYFNDILAGEGTLESVNWGKDHHMTIRFGETRLVLVPKNASWSIAGHPEDRLVCHKAPDLKGECSSH